MPASSDDREHDLDSLFARYFGTAGWEGQPSADHAAGLSRLQDDFENAVDRGQRIALWLVMSRVGAAPRLTASFTDEDDRATARVLAEILAIAGPHAR